MPKKPVNKLTDVQVDTVGLVSLGANQETFFLLKSQEEVEMPNENAGVAEEIPATQTDQSGLLKAIGDLFRSIIKEKPEVEMSEQDREVVAEVTPEVTPASEVEQGEVAKAAFEAQLVELKKANQELMDRVAKAEEIAKAERDSRERAEWVEKAGSYAAIPVPVADLAEQLHFLYKSDPARAEFWMKLMEATDTQLREAGLFAEVGTSQSGVAKGTTDALDAVLKSGNVDAIRDAYLQLGTKEGFNYLEDRRAELARRGR